MMVVVILGQAWAGLTEIAGSVARCLHIPHIGCQLSEEVATRLAVPLEEIADMEHVPTTFWGQLVDVFARAVSVGHGVAVVPRLGTGPLVFAATREGNTKRIQRADYKEAFISVVRELVSDGGVVVTHPSAAWVLKEVPAAVKVFIKAPLRMRVESLMAQRRASRAVALRYFEEADRAQRAYAKTYCGVDPWQLGLYDLVVDVGRINVPKAVQAIAKFALEANDEVYDEGRDAHPGFFGL